MKIYKNVILAIVLIFCLNLSTKAGAWTQKEGGYYFKIESSYLNASKEFNHIGEELNILEEKFIFRDVTFRDITVRAYGEYGIYNNLTLIGKIPFKIYTTQYYLDDLYSQGEVARSTAGFGDLNFALKYGLLNQPMAISIQSGVKLSFGYEKHPDNDGPRLGTGEIDFEGMLLIGQSFHPLPLYASAGLGYRKRGGPLHDEIIYNLETGYTLEKWFFKIYFTGIKNTETPPDLYGGEIQLPHTGGGGVIPDLLVGDQDINQLSFSISYTFQKRMSLEATIYDVISGKNTVSGQTFSLGLAIYK